MLSRARDERHGEIVITGVERGIEARNEIVRQERRIARHGENQIVLSIEQAARDAGQRPGIAFGFIRQYWEAKRAIDIQIAVGADEHFIHLRLNAR